MSRTRWLVTALSFLATIGASLYLIHESWPAERAPAPGGGFIEVAFRAALGGTIPAAIFAASLIWWRFYTFYLYILLGALAAGRTALRALRGNDEERREHHQATLAAHQHQR